MILFNEYLPDQPALGQKGLVSVRNALPDIKGFRQMRDIQPITTALPGTVIGSLWAADDDGNFFFFAATSTGIFRLQNNAWLDISKPGGYNADRWDMVAWGNRVIATNDVDPMQYFDLGQSTAFADLPGSPPRARHIGIVRDFIVIGNVVDQGDERRSRVAWSGFNNSELWAPSPSTQAGFQDILIGGGKVQRIVPGELGVIFLERAVLLMAYAGPKVIFRFDEVESGRGTPAPDSVCWSGNRIFYLGHDGFYAMDRSANNVQFIGANRIDRTITDDVNTNHYDRVVGQIDYRRRLVFWAYPSKASSGTPDKVAIYNWQANKWSVADIAITRISEYISPSLSLDELDTVLADIDSESINVDSDAYKGGLRGLVLFTADNRMGLLEGQPLTAEFETGDFGTQGISMMNRVRPSVDRAASMQLFHGGRDGQADNLDWSTAISLNRINEFSLRKRARYHRLRLVVSGGFEYAVGIEPYLAPAGDR